MTNIPKKPQLFLFCVPSKLFCTKSAHNLWQALTYHQSCREHLIWLSIMPFAEFIHQYCYFFYSHTIYNMFSLWSLCKHTYNTNCYDIAQYSFLKPWRRFVSIKQNSRALSTSNTESISISTGSCYPVLIPWT